MDLSFTQFDCDAELPVLPGDVAALMAGAVQREAAGPTAAAQARRCAAADPLLLRPAHGAFNGAMAVAVVRWRQG